MKTYSLCFALLAVLMLVHPSSARVAQGASSTRKKAQRDLDVPTTQQRKLIEQRAMIEIHNEMGDNADEEEMMRRVDELTQKRMKEAYPDMFELNAGRRNGKTQSHKYARSDNIWENGTVVRYLAQGIGLVLACAALYAFKEQLMGRESFDGRKVAKSVTDTAVDAKKER